MGDWLKRECFVVQFTDIRKWQESGGVFEGGKWWLISPLPIMASLQMKCNCAGQSTWLEPLGTLAAQHQYGKPVGVHCKLGPKCYPNAVK